MLNKTYTPVKHSHDNIHVNLIKHSRFIDNPNEDMFTFEVDMPRFLIPESNTHRATSKNLQSSRAVPFKKTIQLIRDNPYTPVHWGKNQPGMTSKEEFVGQELEEVKALFAEMRESVLAYADRLAEYDPHKQWAARTVEGWGMTKAVISSTWTGLNNLLWLRNDGDAQPEFRVIAELMVKCLKDSVPMVLQHGEWHLPYVNTVRYKTGLMYLDSNGDKLTLSDAQKISASCCAQTSYRRLDDSYEKAIAIYDRLFAGSRLHMSPTEHQATPIANPDDFGVTHIRTDGVPCSGNLTGWIQYRQTLPRNVYTGSMADYLKGV